MAKNKHRQTDLEPKGHTEASKFLCKYINKGKHMNTHTQKHTCSLAGKSILKMLSVHLALRCN